MRYNCKDIKNILEKTNADPKQEDNFLNHLENCSDCQDLVELDFDLEELLITSMPKATPYSYEASVLEKIAKLEKDAIKHGIFEKILIPVVALFSSISIVLAFSFRKVFESFFASLDFSVVLEQMILFAEKIQIPQLDFTGIAANLYASTYLLPALIMATALIWTFSIIEFNKALR